MYRIIELGWQDNEEVMRRFFVSCDIFIMPSLAESFGLMAIEAMAAECVVVCFEGTVIEENTGAPDIGVSVSYKSSSLFNFGFITKHITNSPSYTFRRFI